MERGINKIKFEKGFVLIEMLVALVVFALIITTVVAVFVTSYKSQDKSRDLQQDLENVRVSMESMAKSIRTSNLDYPVSSVETSEIYIYDYSQEKCIGYRFSGDTLFFKEKDISRLNASGTGIINCRTELSSESFVDFLTGTKISFGKFYVRKTKKETGESTNDGYMGRVSIVMKLDDDLNVFETTVSLRDY